jgi:hypothetical protein
MPMPCSGMDLAYAAAALNPLRARAGPVAGVSIADHADFWMARPRRLEVRC